MILKLTRYSKYEDDDELKQIASIFKRVAIDHNSYEEKKNDVTRVIKEAFENGSILLIADNVEYNLVMYKIDEKQSIEDFVENTIDQINDPKMNDPKESLTAVKAMHRLLGWIVEKVHEGNKEQSNDELKSWVERKK